MKPVGTTETETYSGARPDRRRHLNEQLGQLIETVWACERQWTVDERIDAVIRYGSR